MMLRAYIKHAVNTCLGGIALVASTILVLAVLTGSLSYVTGRDAATTCISTNSTAGK